MSDQKRRGLDSEGWNLGALPTRLARAGWREHWFRGAAVFGGLLEASTVWDLWARALDGPALGARERTVLDALAVASTAADPRIPPMKILRLLSSYGSEIAALGALLVAQQEALIGSWTPARAAADLVDLNDAARARLEGRTKGATDPLGARQGDPFGEAVQQVLAEWMAQRRRLAGFGIPARPEDERFVALARRMESLGFAGASYFRLLRRAGAYLQAEHGLPPNIAGGAAAACLDLGFTPRQIGVLATAFGLPSFVGNALEGAEQRPTLLQVLPPACARYAGVAPRLSPRAQSVGRAPGESGSAAEPPASPAEAPEQQ